MGNLILHARSDQYYWKGKGALSIKTFRNGRAFYHVGYGNYAVEEGRYLLLNDGQEYAITIDSETPVESFCIFFPEGMAEEAYYSMVASHEHLLDNPVAPMGPSIAFVEKTYNDQWLEAALDQIKTAYRFRQLDAEWLEEKLYVLVHGLLAVHRQVHIEMTRLPSLKASTREELYKRVQIGHAFIEAYFDQPITLADAARAACLSPNHFLRSYKQLFGVSPHQFLTERRLLEARRLLLHTEKPITGICLEVGFQSPSSFSSLFARRFAASPLQFRRKK
ncbi:helix-turn-helix domain-containing protein [Paenibacillus sp. MMS18-CY102]|uniref:helix-turn-helix domain-containing protein n=1 Tax=Paenibacillus sp. MMS18-CY102 TaxID=2682849 RepID=UPI001365B297|nr:AraC family transcriptional regulator [Paenibacillus sp. MMS18-CY102]MWC27659.1 helix-turn-helix domain-containing protein [Paenibacillus sp. MMS18-CY102]